MNEDKQKILEEIELLKRLMKFHNKLKSKIWKGREKEFQIYFDAMLDRYNELKSELNSLDKNDNEL